MISMICRWLQPIDKMKGYWGKNTIPIDGISKKMKTWKQAEHYRFKPSPMPFTGSVQCLKGIITETLLQRSYCWPLHPNYNISMTFYNYIDYILYSQISWLNLHEFLFSYKECLPSNRLSPTQQKQSYLGGLEAARRVGMRPALPSVHRFYQQYPDYKGFLQWTAPRFGRLNSSQVEPARRPNWVLEAHLSEQCFSKPSFIPVLSTGCYCLVNRNSKKFMDSDHPR